MWKAGRLIALILAAVLAVVPAASLADQPAATEGINILKISGMEPLEIPDNEAMRLVREMKAGWNLGNTFDAYDGYKTFVKGAGLETFWSNPVTTKELLQTIRDAGFNAVRIPVSWHNHTDSDGTIDPEWMARVKEVVDWALDLGLYVIVNVHHDNHNAWYFPDSAHYEQSAAWLKSVWTQMAETFRDCGDHLILESMNEPRLEGTRYEWVWDADSPVSQDAADCINRLNQLFVDTVRATGGSNATRFLAVPAYDASPWAACDDAFRLPEDTVENRLIVSVHAYAPGNFALSVSSKDIYFDPARNQGKTKEILTIMERLYDRFISKGIPVLLDEFGAVEKPKNYQARVNYAAYYTAAASTHGMTCFWWDNGAYGGTGTNEQFGIINRSRSEWVYPDIVLAIMANCEYNR